MYTSKRIKKSMIINNHKYTELHIKMHICTEYRAI